MFSKKSNRKWKGFVHQASRVHASLKCDACGCEIDREHGSYAVDKFGVGLCPQCYLLAVGELSRRGVEWQGKVVGSDWDVIGEFD